MAEVNSRVELEEVLALGVDLAASILDAEVAVISFRSSSGWIFASGFPGATVHLDSLSEDTPEALVRSSGEPPRASILVSRWGEPARAWASGPAEFGSSGARGVFAPWAMRAGTMGVKGSTS